MADVYSNSPCNIAATGASDCAGGFFYNRLAELVEPCIVRTEWTDKPNDDYHIYNTKRWYIRRFRDLPIAETSLGCSRNGPTS